MSSLYLGFAQTNLRGDRRRRRYQIKDLPIRHNLDVMHVEKIAEIFFGTIMDNKDKTKDGIAARKDLQDLKIKRNLWLKERGNGKPPEMLPGPYCLVYRRQEISMPVS
ncbi:hypothetical protein MKW98_001185 [Papaver atlanticum]|uniref:Uncharacterized protein n=1 Tax=Papaver atlanticum TaxID=357466 RepID=A0AAD4STA5_9MAGN|nr:hypothetical protein MKW98_001185 [Papaver atlanticum]